MKSPTNETTDLVVTPVKKQDRDSWEEIEKNLKEQNLRYMAELMGPNFLQEHNRKKESINSSD